MAKFVEIDGVYINPDRVTFLVPALMEESATNVFFGGGEDDCVRVDGGVMWVAAMLSGETLTEFERRADEEAEAARMNPEHLDPS